MPKFNKVAVVFIIDFDDAPWISTTADFTAIGRLDQLVRADDGEGDLAGNLFRLSKRLFVFVLIGGCLEDVDVMVGNVGKNLPPKSIFADAQIWHSTYPSLELRHLLIREGVRLCDNRNQVDPCVQLAHELDINGL